MTPKNVLERGYTQETLSCLKVVVGGRIVIGQLVRISPFKILIRLVVNLKDILKFNLLLTSWTFIMLKMKKKSLHFTYSYNLNILFVILQSCFLDSIQPLR